MKSIRLFVSLTENQKYHAQTCQDKTQAESAKGPEFLLAKLIPKPIKFKLPIICRTKLKKRNFYNYLFFHSKIHERTL